MKNIRDDATVYSFKHVHEDINSDIRRDMIKDELAYELGVFFKVFGDETRIKILYVLSKTEMCVCDIADLLNMTQSAISHQLRVLRNARLVKYKREGKAVYYSLDDEHVENIFAQGLEHITHSKK